MLDSKYVYNQIDRMGVSYEAIAQYMHESPSFLRSRLDGQPKQEFLLKVLASAMSVKQIMDAETANKDNKSVLMEGFMVYFDLWSELDELPDDQFKELFYDVLTYAKTGEEMTYYSDNAVKIAFLNIKRRIDKDSERYKRMIEQKRAAGRRSGQVRNMNKITKHYNVYVESLIQNGDEYNE